MTGKDVLDSSEVVTVNPCVGACRQLWQHCTAALRCSPGAEQLHKFIAMSMWTGQVPLTGYWCSLISSLPNLDTQAQFDSDNEDSGAAETTVCTFNSYDCKNGVHFGSRYDKFDFIETQKEWIGANIFHLFHIGVFLTHARMLQIPYAVFKRWG